ncbi:MAG: response regulator [candidate division Zixibacteria bacterium]|nr:response regulator [candidate division Zixibacteria bacterium]
MCVLIVDDEEIIRVLATKILQRAGMTTQTADSSQNGLRLVAENPAVYKLAILDLSMPGMSGVDLIREIRRFIPGIPCILSSGYPINDSDVSDDIKPNTFFLQKPYKPQELTLLVQSILGTTPVKV